MSTNSLDSPDVAGQNTHGEATAASACPKCSHRITLDQILFAAFPLWLTCRNCKAKLIGGLFIHLQALFILSVIFILAVLALTFWTYWSPTLFEIQMVGGISLAIMIPFAAINVLVTMKWGRYALRRP